MESEERTRERVLQESAIHLLHRAGQCAGDVFAEEVSAGLTPRQFAVLAAVAGQEGLSQADLVAQTGIDRSTLADIIRRMLNKGLVSRQRTEADARAYAVRLTEAGRAMLREARPGVANADSRLLAVLPPEQRGEFLDCLSAIVQALGDTDGQSTG
jgi:DNA-binding MarR family transcriptional regulator